MNELFAEIPFDRILTKLDKDFCDSIFECKGNKPKYHKKHNDVNVTMTKNIILKNTSMN